MDKGISFLRDTKLNLFSAPCALVAEGDQHLAVTRNHSLIIKSGGEQKTVIGLDKQIAFEPKEFTKVLQRVGPLQFVLITSRFNVFLLTLNEQKSALARVQPISFRYQKNYKPSTLTRSIAVDEGLFLLGCGKAIFAFAAKTGQFQLLKVLNESFVDFALCKLEASSGLRLHVLTQKNLLTFSLDAATGVQLRPENKQDVEGGQKLAVLGDRLALLAQDSSLLLFDSESGKLQKQLALLSSASDEVLEVKSLLALGCGSLALLSGDFLLTLDKKLEKVADMLSVKDADFLVAGDEFVDLARKTENLIKVAEVVNLSYTKDNKLPLFHKQQLDDQLALAFSYLSRRFLKLSSFSNHKTMLQDALAGLHLSGKILKHKKFREHLLRFLALTKHFSTVESDAKCLVNGPVVAFGRDPFEDQEEETALMEGRRASGDDCRQPIAL